MYNGLIVEELIKEDIINAVRDYEPRIEINGSNIQIIRTDRTVQIYIQYIIKETGEINEFNLELSHDDNPYA